MNDWPVVKLGDVAEFLDSRRKPIKQSDRHARIAGLSRDKLYPYYGATGQAGWIDNYLFDEPLILLAEDGGPFGSTTQPISYEVRGRCWVNNHAHVLRPRDGVDFDYLKFAVHLRPDVLALTSGNTRLKLNQANARQIPLPLPPMSEQRAIAKRLGEQMAQVATARAAAEANVEAASLLHSRCLGQAFGRPPSTGWQQRSLGELIARYNSICHPGAKTGAGVFVGLEHIESHTGRRNGKNCIDLGALTGRKPAFKAGQIVYGYLRPYLNKVWVAEFDGYSSVDQFAFEVDPATADRDFVAMFMRSPAFLERSHVVTTTGQLPRISIDQVLSVPIDAPSSIAEQAAFAQRVREQLEIADSMAVSVARQRDDIDSVRPSLLRNVFGD